MINKYTATISFFGAFFGLLGLAVAGAAQAAPDAQTCAAGARIATAVAAYSYPGKAPVVLSQAGPMQPSYFRAYTIDDPMSRRYWTEWYGQAPTPAMARMMNFDTNPSVAACWNSGQAGAPFPVVSEAESTRLEADPTHQDKTVLHMTLPVLNDDKTLALVYAETFCPGRCMVQMLYTLSRNGDAWTVSGRKVLGAALPMNLPMDQRPDRP